jgi:hypothetical protein
MRGAEDAIREAQALINQIRACRLRGCCKRVKSEARSGQGSIWIEERHVNGCPLLDRH